MDAQNQFSAKEKEMASLKQRLSYIEKDKEKIGKAKKELEQGISKLKEDLTMMTVENQTLHEEIRRITAEKERLVAKVNECSQTILKYEEELVVKVRERERETERELTPNITLLLLYIIEVYFTERYSYL